MRWNSRMSFLVSILILYYIPWNSWNNCNVLTTRWHCEIAHIAEAPIGCWSLLGTILPSSKLWSWQQPTWQQFPSTTLQLHRFVIELAGQVQRVPSSWFWENSGAPFSADLVVSFCISCSMSIRPSHRIPAAFFRRERFKTQVTKSVRYDMG